MDTEIIEIAYTKHVYAIFLSVYYKNIIIYHISIITKQCLNAFITSVERKVHMTINKKKLVTAIVYAICFAFLGWVVISYIEVISNNLDPNPQYSSWNAFELFVKAYRVKHGVGF